MHPLLGGSSLSEPEQFTSECKRWIPKVAPGATEITSFFLFKDSGEGGSGDQLNQWYHLGSPCFEVNSTLFLAVGWRLAGEPTLPSLAGPAPPCAWSRTQLPSRRARAFPPAPTWCPGTWGCSCTAPTATTSLSTPTCPSTSRETRCQVRNSFLFLHLKNTR